MGAFRELNHSPSALLPALLSLLESSARSFASLFSETPLKIGFLDGAELQVHQRSQASGSPRMEFAGIHFSDHSFDSIAHCSHAIQIRQWIASGGDAAVLPSANPAQFRSFLGVGVEEAESAISRAARQGLPLLVWP